MKLLTEGDGKLKKEIRTFIPYRQFYQPGGEGKGTREEG